LTSSLASLTLGHELHTKSQKLSWTFKSQAEIRKTRGDGYHEMDSRFELKHLA